jgi:hypothetical protein
MKKDDTNMNPVRENSKAFKQKKLEIYNLFTIRLY